MAIQVRNAELVSLLSPDFQLRNEPNHAWVNAVAGMQMLPGLRGLWSMSAYDSSGNAQDQSGHGHVLTYNGNPKYGYTGLAPYIDLDGAGDFLERADEADLDITGTEAYVLHPGLTLGGWWYPEDNASLDMLITKAGGAGNRSYFLAFDGTAAGPPADVVTFGISDDGTNYATVNSATTRAIACAINTWHFVAGRFNDALAGAELSIWLNGEQTTAATARNSIFSGNAALRVGDYAPGGFALTGNASLVFLCASALSDAAVFSIYQQTRALFAK
jgi:hypothetical protein